MTLSVIIPVYNEAAGLAQTLAAVQALPGDLEVLVIDGGSRRIEPGHWRKYLELNGRWSAGYRIAPPFSRRKPGGPRRPVPD